MKVREWRWLPPLESRTSPAPVVPRVNAGEKLPALVPPTENVIERWLKSVWNVPYWSENENRSVGLSL